MEQVSYQIKGQIQWTRPREDEGSDSFSRRISTRHKMQVSGRQELEMTAYHRFGGEADMPSPEEIFVSAVSSCLMLTFLDLAQKNRLMVKTYRDESEASLTRDADKRWSISYILLRPRITLLEEKNSDVRGRAVRLLHEAHYYCFLVNSIRASVDIEPLLVIEEDI